MPEIDESELPRELRGKYDHALAAVNKKNYDYAILLLKDLLKQVPGFVEGRIILRESQRKKKGGGGLFSKIVGTATGSPALAKGEMALRKGDYATALTQSEECSRMTLKVSQGTVCLPRQPMLWSCRVRHWLACNCW